MPQRHSTDEELIAKLDGELGLLAASSVHQHLQVCWQCRGRMRELEDQALHIARAMAHDAFPGPTRVALAVRRFSVWREQGQRQSLRPFTPDSRRHLASSAAIAGTLGVALACLGVIRFQHPAPHVSPAPPPAKTVTLAAQRAEQVWINQPFHETLAIEVEGAASNTQARSHLELWSDRRGQRLAVEWRDDAGHLRAAHWKPDARRNYLFAPAGSAIAAVPDSSPLFSFASIELTGSARDLQQLDAQLLRYVMNQSLRLVSLSGTFAEFAGNDGMAVRVERAPAPGGTIRLLASRQSNGITAELILEVDAETLHASSLRVRLHDARHSVQAAFVVEKFETLQPGQLKLATFEPKGGRSTVVPPVRSATTKVEGPPAANPDFGEKEIDIHYALHRIRACLEDPIRVEHLQSGRIVVRGLVGSDVQKERILSLLRDFDGVEAEIKTVAEAVREPARLPIGPLLHSDPVALQIGNASFPMREKLQSHFSGLTDSQDRAREIAYFSNQVVSLSGSALAEAWAIHRLRQTFSPGHPDPLGLIEQMVADHAAAFHGRVEELRALLQPMLPACSNTPSSPAPLQAAESMDHLVRAMFSSSREPYAAPDSDLQRLADALSTSSHIDFTEREP